MCPECRDCTAEAAVVPGVGDVARNDALGSQSVDGGILDTRRDIGIFKQGRAGLVRCVCRYEVASVHLVGRAGLECAGVEAVGFAFAVRVFGCAAVAHVAVALELRVLHLQAVVDVPLRQGDHVLQPSCHLHGVDGVVVAEAVAVFHAAVRIVEVILQHVGVAGEVAFGKCVDVLPELAAEKVAYRLEVVSRRIVELYASLKAHVVVQAVVDRRVEVELELVADAVLEYVYRTFALVVGQAFLLHVGEVVGLIEGVPVDLAVKRYACAVGAGHVAVTPCVGHQFRFRSGHAVVEV